MGFLSEPGGTRGVSWTVEKYPFLSPSFRFRGLVLGIVLCLTSGCARRATVTEPERIARRLSVARDAYFHDGGLAMAEVAGRIDGYIQIHPAEDDAAHLLWRIARAWESLQRHEDALAVLENAFRFLGRSRESENGFDYSPLRQERALAYVYTHRRLAGLYEEKEDWERLRACWEAWRPFGIDCGNAAAAFTLEKTIAIATCKYRIGEVDAALENLWPWLETDRYVNGPAIEAAIACARISAGTDRLTEARARIEAIVLRNVQERAARGLNNVAYNLPLDKSYYRVPFDLEEAALAGDVEAIRQDVERLPNDHQGRALREFAESLLLGLQGDTPR